MSSLHIFYNQLINSIRLYFIKKLIGKKFKIVSNITITSDIISYNKGIDKLYNVKVKRVSSRQSFIYVPSSPTNCY